VDSQTEIDTNLRGVLRQVLSLPAHQADALNAASPLFGALPELDSMAVAGVLTEIEDRFHIVIDDDEVDGEIFESFGALAAFVAIKLNRPSRS
jgi:acyl carrier protein